MSREIEQTTLRGKAVCPISLTLCQQRWADEPEIALGTAASR